MSHVHSQKIRRAFYVAGILTGMFFVPEMLVDAANLMVTIPSNCIRILSPHLRWGTRWSCSFA